MGRSCSRAPRASLAPVTLIVIAALTGCGGTVVFEEGSGGGSTDGAVTSGTGRPSGVTTTSVIASSASGLDDCIPDSSHPCDGGATCIPISAVCDGVQDCADGTDEIECSAGCTDTEFPCDDGSCIPGDFVCDQELDCAGGEDETHQLCGVVKCDLDELPCVDGTCVPDSWVCDGEADCALGEDEDANVCTGQVCDVPGLSAKPLRLAYCLTAYCCDAVDACLANGLEECLDCLDEGGGPACDDLNTCSETFC